MPWHDIGHSLKGEVVKDLLFHFYQLWNFVRYENKLSAKGLFPPSLF
jgi:phosphatidylserine/phosphatidylglycerophosphate/cardiolipin synthase-like enzyme